MPSPYARYCKAFSSIVDVGDIIIRWWRVNFCLQGSTASGLGNGALSLGWRLNLS